ncbi:MAG: bifunctional hydroxymethylpyrimidine kinase/phosphomethylpyrimidine kinase [Selenomonadaceae bacterium]|nr:bifunctional hydroxymethylpyrimidine kinase/phosphomethylpyrimidine kinase [Selenomonadaceae bacterium]
MTEPIIPVLTIAGSDASGGAGIQADLKTFLAHGVYGMSAVTALTAQNTQGVRAIQEATPEFLAQEIDAVFDDIRPRAVKVGMVASAALIQTIAEKLREHHAAHVVVDPVMVATSGAALLAGDAMTALKEELFPCAELLTPNLPELTRLTGIGIVSVDAMAAAAERAARDFGTAVLAKGGHFAGGEATDLLAFPDGRQVSLSAPRSENPNTHGTGCTLSSAIAANLAKGLLLEEAVRRAKAYLTGAIGYGLDLGEGRGPLWHGWALSSRFF